jgi:DNA-binding NtrC family response regulator
MQQLLQDYEEELLRAALHKTEGHIVNAAHLTGLKKTTFIQKMKKLGLRRSEFVT